MDGGIFRITHEIDTLVDEREPIEHDQSNMPNFWAAVLVAVINGVAAAPFLIVVMRVSSEKSRGFTPSTARGIDV
jgi:hypothetical protein